MSGLFGEFRLDAEAYTPELINVYDHLATLETVRLGDHAFITDGQHGYHIVDPESPIRHLTASCVLNWFIDDSGAERLAHETHDKNQRSACEVNDILLSTAGTLGKAGIITPDVLPANIDQDVARIHLLDKTINPWYLITFLNSSIGRLQSERVSTGQVQRHIALGKIREFKIPVNVAQESVAQLTKQAFEKHSQSKALYAEAEALLLRELGLDTLDLTHEPSYEATFEEMAAAGRMDAEYFQPKYEHLLERIQQSGQGVRLADWVARPIQRGTQPEYIDDGDVIVINSQHVGKTHVELNDNRHTSHDLVNKKAIVEPYDVLLNSTGYITIGRSQVLLDDVAAVVDGHVSIIKTKPGLDPVYLALFLNTLPGQLQTERNWTGSSGQIELRLEAINNYLILKPDASLQYEIRHKVEAAHHARQEAALLLDEAKRRVEVLVLGG